jgi:hypothetical protein
MLQIDLTILIVLLIGPSDGAHFRGGTISWVPANPSISFPVSTVGVQITSRFYFTYNTYACNTAADVAAANLINSGSIASTSGPTWSISASVNCKGFSVADGWQEGQLTQTVSITTAYQVSGSYAGSAWISPLTSLTNSASWNMVFKIDVRQRADTKKINSSPYTTSSSTVKMGINCPLNQSFTIDVYDSDNDFIRCSCNTNVCIANFIIDKSKCIFFFNPTVVSYYAIEILIEDYMYENSTQPLSSVPFQFLANAVNDNTYCCKINYFTYILLLFYTYDSNHGKRFRTYNLFLKVSMRLY